MKFSKNDAINYAAILVIVVSIASIGMELTGFSTVDSTALVNITVDSSAAINFTTDLVFFGNGSVDSGPAGSHLYTNGTVVDGSWAGTASGLVLENIGNTNVSLSIEADQAAAAYIGGLSPEYQYIVTEAEANSCTAGTTGTYEDFTTSNVTICPNFPAGDSFDTVNIGIHLYVPSAGKVGALTSTVTATGGY